MPAEDEMYYVITCGRQAGGLGGGRRTPFFAGAYLQDYASYDYEISWVDRSHQGGVQGTGTITLACLNFSSPEHNVLKGSF